jgi:hypothetical protein
MGKGHNHHADCGCGWCSSNWGNTRTDRSQLRKSMQSRDAERILKEQRARNGYSSCFISPNARCPVCNASVFYYQNDHGSRVFFDDLGPPWPKHPCTDNPNLNARATSPRPKLRPRGSRVEIVEAASLLGLYAGARYHQSGYAIDWQKIEIIGYIRRGWEIFATAKLIEIADEPIVRFSITSQDEIIAPGEFVSGCYSAISIFHPFKLHPKSYSVVWYGDANFAEAITTAEHEISLRRVLRSSSPAPQPVENPSRLIRRDQLRLPKTKSPSKPKAKAKQVTKKIVKERAIKPQPAMPKEKSENQVRREEMLSKVVVERRAIPNSRRQK